MWYMHEDILDKRSIPGRGGQSALRFARLRMEKRHNYVRKVAYFAYFALNIFVQIANAYCSPA